VARPRVAKAKRGKRPARADRRRPAPAAEGVPEGDAARLVWAAAVSEAMARGEPCALALVDVDGFGGHAERVGRERADALLEQLVARLQGELSDQALLGRLAGDLFGVAFPGVEVEPALGLVERVRQAVASAPFEFGQGRTRRRVQLTVSVGLAGVPRDGADATALLEQARAALWRAKSLGGDRVGLPAREKMLLKTSYYPQRQLEQLKRIAERAKVPEAVLLREALDDLFLKRKARRPDI
jgi:diguanylate cyclase (GGDEF)-like protein